MKVIKVELSADGLKKLSQKLKTFTSEIEKETKNIQKELLEDAKKEIERGYSTSPYEGYQEEFTIDKTENKVYVSGTQVIYREFGTGTQGASDAHPIKDDFGLNAYNSGSTIRKAGVTINPETGILPGELYWTFYKDGTKYYTTGIPSGKEVYRASIKTREKLDKIIKERLGGAISKL